MKKLRIGVVGAGLIGQVEHIPNLLKMEDRFELIGVADASQRMRAALEARGIKAFPDHLSLLNASPDALLVAAPDQYHADMTLAALSRAPGAGGDPVGRWVPVVAAEIIGEVRRQIGHPAGRVAGPMTAGPDAIWASEVAEGPSREHALGAIAHFEARRAVA